MNEDQAERAALLYNRLSDAMHALLNKALDGELPEVDEMVREQLGEQFRFWRQ